MTWTQTGGQSDRSVLLSTEQGGEEWARLQGHCEPGRAHGERMERPRVPGGQDSVTEEVTVPRTPGPVRTPGVGWDQEGDCRRDCRGTLPPRASRPRWVSSARSGLSPVCATQAPTLTSQASEEERCLNQYFSIPLITTITTEGGFVVKRNRGRFC